MAFHKLSSNTLRDLLEETESGLEDQMTEDSLSDLFQPTNISGDCSWKI